MLSLLGTLLAIFAAVHLVTGLSHWVHRRQRQFAPEHRPMALLMFCAGIACFGTMLLLEAQEDSVTKVGLSLRLTAFIWAAPLFVEFQQALLRRAQPRVLLASRFTGVLGSAIVLGSMARIETLQRIPPVWRFPWTPIHGQPVLPPFVQGFVLVCAGASLIFVAHSLARMAKHARDDGHTAAIVFWFGVACAAGTVDLFARFTVGQILYLVDIGLFFAALAAGRIMLARYIRNSQQLAERSRQLERTRTEVLRTEHELLQSKRLAAMGELSAVIAHEVRNPLAIIKNAVSALRRTSARHATESELLSILIEETKRLNRLVNDLHDFAQPLVPLMGPLDTHELVQATVSQAGAHAAPDQAERIHVEGIAHRHIFSGDPDLLRLALANVIDNALQATRNQGHVSVTVSQAEDDWIDFVVQDTGLGMSEETMAKAMDPFFTTRPTGTGLGLAVVDRVVRAHGGVVSVESQLGAGTRVVLRLPCGAQTD